MQRDETCSDEERALLQAKFWQLLARQTALFTMGESRSVPHETAQELLRSLCYILKIDGIHDVERIKNYCLLICGKNTAAVSGFWR